MTDAQWLVSKARVEIDLAIEQSQATLIENVSKEIAYHGLYVGTSVPCLKLRRDIRRLRSLGFKVKLAYMRDWVDVVHDALLGWEPELTVVVTLPQ